MPTYYAQWGHAMQLAANRRRMLDARAIIAALKSKMAACLPETESSRPLAIQVLYRLTLIR